MEENKKVTVKKFFNCLVTDQNTHEKTWADISKIFTPKKAKLVSYQKHWEAKLVTENLDKSCFKTYYEGLKECQRENDLWSIL